MMTNKSEEILKLVKEAIATKQSCKPFWYF